METTATLRTPRINGARVLLGGLFAGLVLNVGEAVLNAVILAEETAAAADAIGVTPHAWGVVWAILWSFGMGLVLAWLYAVARPRLGAGPKNAILVGLAAWYLAFFFNALMALWQGLLPATLVWTVLVWRLVETPLASLAGAWLYRE